MATYQGSYTGPQIDALLARVNSSPGALGLSSVYYLLCPNVSDTKRTLTSDAITADQIVVGLWTGGTLDWSGNLTISTSAGSVSFTGTLTGTGNVMLIMASRVAYLSAT